MCVFLEVFFAFGRGDTVSLGPSIYISMTQADASASSLNQIFIFGKCFGSYREKSMTTK